jgi:GPH family glycoside/pentoside/hexuronide:cation symporter
MILAFSFPLMIAMFLLYTDIQMPMAVKPLYYGFMTMVAWTSYTGFFVPYLALGADYTSDYDDRTVLRMFSSIFNMGGALLAMVLPTLLVEFLQGFGISVGHAWSMTGLLLGTVTFASIIITVAASRRKDPPCPRQSDEAAAAGLRGSDQHQWKIIGAVIGIFREYVSVAKLGPMKFLVAASLLALIGYTMVMSDMVYIFTFNMGLSAVQVSGCMALRAILSLILIPIISKLILMTDRRETLIGCYIVGAVGMVMVRMVDLPQLSWILVYMFFATICTSMYWQIMPGIFYDICEYDRIVNGKKGD